MEKAATIRRGRPPLLPLDKKGILEYMMAYSMQMKKAGKALPLISLAEEVMVKFDLTTRLRDNEFGKKGGKIRQSDDAKSEWGKRKEVVRQAIIPMVREAGKEKIWYDRIPDNESVKKLRKAKQEAVGAPV